MLLHRHPTYGSGLSPCVPVQYAAELLMVKVDDTSTEGSFNEGWKGEEHKEE